jgi:multidrug efflux pump subunit AcrA (membrane-fusion protein)
MTFKHLLAKVAALPKLYSIGAVVVVAAGFIGAHALSHSPAPAAATSDTPHVHIASVAGLSSSVGPLPITGKVTSLSEATILSQSSGEIVSLLHSIGDYVPAGVLIAAFENSSQQAAVQQAQGSYDAAAAALSKATGAKSGENATVAAHAALLSAYGALDDAVHARADQLFTNPKTSFPDLVITVPDSALVNTIKGERVSLEDSLAAAAKLGADLGSVDAALASMTGYAQATQAFLDDLIRAVNSTPASQSASASTLSGYQTMLAAARSEVTAAITSLNSTKSSYDATVSSASGDVSNDVKAAQANVTQALGALNAAKANLEKTLVRSSISGTIVSLSVTKGDFVSAFSQVAVVSNPRALYIDAQVTPEDAKTLAIGNKALIQGTLPGIVTFIAPALDPLTNKIEVKIAPSGENGSLTNGDVVTIAVDRLTAAKPSAGGAGRITIPIIAAKITPAGPIVFSLSASTTLVAHTVALGSILGDQVVVTTGLTPDMEIVTDARGLAEGDAVIVDAD